VKIGVPKEISEGERRVGLVPETVGRLVKDGYEVLVESGAGQDYNLDEDYEEAGAKIASGPEEVYGEADIIIKVTRSSEEEVEHLREGTVLACFLNGPQEPALVKKLADAGVTVFSNELVPRTSRAQSMDALSSMGSIAGYKCAIIGANALGKYVPTLSTAAGTTPAAKVIVLGAAVAGLQAIATMNRLGAEVFAYDIMPVVKDQVRSVGGTFIDSADLEQEDVQEDEQEKEYEPAAWRKVMEFFGFYSFVRPPEPAEDEEDEEGSDEEEEERQGGPFSKEKQEEDYKLVREHLRDTDIVITTAVVPGRPPPVLMTQDMVEEMQPGTVVVDLAGGNCELTEAGETVEHEHVSIIGPVNLPSRMPIHASQLYSRNMRSLIDLIVEDVSDEDSDEKDLQVVLDFEDDIIDATCIAHDGGIRSDKVREALENVAEESEA
jgi:NAD(P) transhydrogenase subunit alpha